MFRSIGGSYRIISSKSNWTRGLPSCPSGPNRFTSTAATMRSQWSPTHRLTTFFPSGNRTRRWKFPTISTAYPCDQGEFQDFWLLIGWSILHFGSTALFLGGWRLTPVGELPESSGRHWLLGIRANRLCNQVYAPSLDEIPQLFFPKRWVSLVQDRLLNMDYHCGGFYEEVATLATARAGTGLQVSRFSHSWAVQPWLVDQECHLSWF